ncbi:sensor histidine kinase [Geomesophilobacter sediminis]|uniref:histidine kinase n=1 Tax=Geomesophilobacter sediminis TaxID=2798584 RepID=A0A8J7IP31_9BACT|nr:ATP-binding protein [Geomesophilobacter sediminis]MBJ6723979.1 HAMP domain-containing protein [Geomesophilobacter sediminis]
MRRFPFPFLAKSFRFRLYFLYSATIALLTGAFVSFYVYTEFTGFRSALIREGRLLATVLAQNARLPLFAENREALWTLAKSTGRYPSVLQVSIVTADGKLLTQVKERTAVKERTIEMEVPVTSPGLVSSPDAVLLGHAAGDEDRVIGRVRLSLDTSDMRERLRKLIYASIGIGIAFWALASLLSYQILNRVTASFNLMMGGIEKIGSGNLSARVALDGDDELGRAANAINEMAASLELRELENRELQEELINAMKLEVQEEKKQVMARLIQTNKMTSLGLLLSSMAHEINNPNASIRFSGHLIEKMWRDAVPLLDGVRREEGDFYLGGVPFATARDAVAENAAKIVENSERIARVVQGLREYGVGGGTKRRPNLDVNGAVSGALSVLACQMKQQVMLKTSLCPTLPPVNGSQQQIEQVLINLITNAMQAFPNGCGEVVVTTALDREQNEVVVVVRDNGVGIEEETMHRLFEPFYSTRLESGGSGLGLYISQYIVADHGGKLVLTSRPGEGTTAQVRLPAAEPLTSG